MKTLLLLLFILSAFSSLAQNSFLGPHYERGTYYTLDNQKHEGFIHVDYNFPSLFSTHPDRYFLFKANKTASSEKIKASTLLSFVVKEKDTSSIDSFTVIHNIEKEPLKFEHDFIQVLINGKTKLYYYLLTSITGVSAAAVMTSTTENFYYGESTDKIIKISRKSFIEAMSIVLGDDPGLVKLVKSKEYTIDNMEDLINQYKFNQAAYKN